jgi:hypothetical protein
MIAKAEVRMAELEQMRPRYTALLREVAGLGLLLGPWGSAHEFRQHAQGDGTFKARAAAMAIPLPNEAELRASAERRCLESVRRAARARPRCELVARSRLLLCGGTVRVARVPRKIGDSLRVEAPETSAGPWRLWQAPAVGETDGAAAVAGSSTAAGILTLSDL